MNANYSCENSRELIMLDRKKNSNEKLLEDELLKEKLFENHSFQFILNRELQRRMKLNNSKQNKKIK